MRSDPTLLAFDTSAAHCAAALLSEGAIRSDATEPMARGQAEALMPLLEETMAANGLDWSDLDALAVGIGPGNFTGIRISVSAARGLALALGIPAAGVSMFEVMASDDQGNIPAVGDALICLKAPRDMAYAQLFRCGRPHGAPRLIAPDAPPPDLGVSAGTLVIGHGAIEFARRLRGIPDPREIGDIPRRVALIAARRLATGAEEFARPAPLYVRPADAAPPSDPPPVILP